MRRTENPENVVQLHEAPQETALWYNGSTTGFGSVSEGSTPSGATKVLHGVMVAYQISVLEVVVRNRLKREQKPSLLGLCRVHGDSQRNPSGVYMEFVAQLVECQVVALVVVGSIPIKLPNASIAQW